MSEILRTTALIALFATAVVSPLAATPLESAVPDAYRQRAASTIGIIPGSPAEIVQLFYKYLREKKFREALLLTNLRPAIEGLTDLELKEFQLDFERIAVNVPSDIQVNGEIIAGDSATVTANLPDNDDLDASQMQEIRLRRDNASWTILTVDDEAEAKIKAEGRNYFYSLKIDSHQDDARVMLDRIAKAQMAFSAANQGRYGDVEELVRNELLAPDVRSSDSTGYNYAVKVFDGGKKYSVIATPAIYGKTGKLTFSVDLDKKGQPHLTSKDTGGK
jgi:hypothetical protein